MRINAATLGLPDENAGKDYTTGQGKNTVCVDVITNIVQQFRMSMMYSGVIAVRSCNEQIAPAIYILPKPDW